MAIVDFSANELLVNEGTIATDDYGSTFRTQGTYDNQATYNRGDRIEYTIPVRASYGDGTGTFGDTSEGFAIDSVHWYYITVTHIENGVEVSDTKLVVRFQTDVGDVFIQEYANSNAGIHNLDGLEITGITFNNTWAQAGNVTYDSWTIENSMVVCFADGTPIATDSGDIAVEDLKVGDRVRILDNGYQAVRWIGRRPVDGQFQRANPKLRPVRISAGAIGNGLPERDLVVPRQHRLLVSSKIANRMFGVAEMLIAANKLVGQPGIMVRNDLAPVTYFHILFDRHEVIFANGTPAESLYLGKEARMSLTPEALTEIRMLFPDFERADTPPALARLTADNPKKLKTLMRRHLVNSRPLVELSEAGRQAFH